MKKIVAWAFICFFTSFCFFWIKDVAFVERGYEAVGGEWLIWLIPALLWVGLNTAREIRRELKKEDTVDEGENV